MKSLEYWDKKHPKVAQLYRGRPLPDGSRYEMDIRHFIWPSDIQLQQIIKDNNLYSENNDVCAHNVQKYVVNAIKYVSDKKLGCSEYWLYPSETIALHQGDCEDGAILMASLLLNLLPKDQHGRVRVAAGWVQKSPTAPQGGHAYVDYCRCKDNEWTAHDWCYYEDSNIPTAEKPLVKNVSFYKNVWFSFNHKNAWSHEDFAMVGRIKDGTDLEFN